MSEKAKPRQLASQRGSLYLSAAQVVSRARKILRALEEESGRPAAPAEQSDDQVSFAAMAESEVAEAIRRCQVDTLSPLEALNLLYELKSKL